MYKQSFGSSGQVRFDNENDYYELLGYLAKSDGTSSLVWERNEEQGAWGSEGRIKFYTEEIPVSADLTLTAGVGNVIHRVNCNEFVKNIANNHHFEMGREQDIEAIRATVPHKYLPDFERGLELDLQQS